MQTTSHILMIRPVRFGFNEQTATSNAFQDPMAAAQVENVQQRALHEFDTMVNQLRAVGVDVIVVDDTLEPHTPDSIFPNNWVSFHQDGTVCLYPMQAENRRLERSLGILDQLEENFHVDNIIDFTSYEMTEKFLEGTGSMVLDRANRIAYACLSPRTDEDVLKDFTEKLGYLPVLFNATDSKGKQIYHTNVVMTVGNLFAVVCLECVRDTKERFLLRNTLEKSQKEVIEITMEQMNNFAGNMLQVSNNRGESLLVMSTRACQSLTPQQIKALEEYAQLIHIELNTIENNGGGSARCMMAEVHLPVR